MMYTFCTLTYM